jgi:parvulin-like peptidyl-prolyl isomerase
MRGSLAFLLLGALAAAPLAFGSAERPSEPEKVTVQHILISFKGKTKKPVTRKKAEAEELARSLMDRIAKGEDFDALVKQYTDDSPPGIYGMSNTGVTKGMDEFQREQMVPAFGNVGFAISVGNIGIADYDPSTSPYGWHVIKRLK